MEDKFIAISEDEYNLFKHSKYKRKIQELEIKILELEKEKIEIAKAKAVRLSDHIDGIKLYSDSDFENEILNDIKNTEFRHVFTENTRMGRHFNIESIDYIEINESKYYKNEYCEDLKIELSYLCREIKEKKEELSKIESQVKLLESIRDKEVEKEETEFETSNRKMNHLGDGFLRALFRKFSKYGK